MNLNAIRYFMEVAKFKSFNKAAKNIYISQPALRSAISNLEREIGGPLFVRNKSGCSLTELGEKVYADAPQIFKIIDEWKECADNHKHPVKKIIIYSTKPFCDTVLIPTITEFQDNWPEYNFIINSTDCLNSIQLLKEEKCQLAVIHTDILDEKSIRKKFQLNDEYVIKKITEDHYLALVNQAVCQSKDQMSAADLHDLIYTNVSDLEAFTQYDFLKNGLASDQKAIYCDSHYSIFQIINNNKNYYSILSGILSKSDFYKVYPNICFKPILDFPYNSAFYFVCHISDYNTMADRLFKKFVQHFTNKETVVPHKNS